MFLALSQTLLPQKTSGTFVKIAIIIIIFLQLSQDSAFPWFSGFPTMPSSSLCYWFVPPCFIKVSMSSASLFLLCSSSWLSNIAHRFKYHPLMESPQLYIPALDQYHQDVTEFLSTCQHLVLSLHCVAYFFCHLGYNSLLVSICSVFQHSSQCHTSEYL